MKYGSYPFDPNSTLLSASSQTRINNGGQPYSEVRSFTVQGYLSGSGQADLADKENALKTALAKPYQDLRFLTDGGNNSADVLLNSGSISGVKITHGPIFSTSQGPEYATIRSFQFTAEAEYPLDATKGLLLDWNETLQFSGGGPLYAHRRAINGPPQKQLIYPATEYRVIQQGMAVGYRAYPLVPPPKFPAAMREAPDIRRKSPRRMGNGWQEYELTWSYVFESAAPLVALPTVWIK